MPRGLRTSLGASPFCRARHWLANASHMPGADPRASLRSTFLCARAFTRHWGAHRGAPGKTASRSTNGEAIASPLAAGPWPPLARRETASASAIGSPMLCSRPGVSPFCRARPRARTTGSPMRRTSQAHRRFAVRAPLARPCSAHAKCIAKSFWPVKAPAKGPPSGPKIFSTFFQNPLAHSPQMC